MTDTAYGLFKKHHIDAMPLVTWKELKAKLSSKAHGQTDKSTAAQLKEIAAAVKEHFRSSKIKVRTMVTSCLPTRTTESLRTA